MLPRDVWQPACVALGSNLSRPILRLGQATRALAGHADVRVHAVSSVYRSAPFGGVEQADFLNAALRLTTRLAPRRLLRLLKGIETEMGRDASGERWGPRLIDLDLLVYRDLIADGDGLTLPHPGIGCRNFVLLPLREIAPDLVVPGLGRVRHLPVPDEPAIACVADPLSVAS